MANFQDYSAIMLESTINDEEFHFSDEEDDRDFESDLEYDVGEYEIPDFQEPSVSLTGV